MLAFEDAAGIALDAVGDDGLAVDAAASKRKAYGWIVIFNSKRYVETRDMNAMIPGIGPVVVLDDRTAHVLPSGPPDKMVAELERRKKLTP